MTSTLLRTLALTLALATTMATTTAMVGCAATKRPPNDTDLRLQAANHFFGGRYEYLVIHSGGQFADGFFVRATRITGPSQIARDLGTRLAQAEQTKLRIMVSGADRDKTIAVIRDAFSFHTKSRLPGLEFLFLGDPRDEATVRKLVESVGGVAKFAAFES